MPARPRTSRPGRLSEARGLAADLPNHDHGRWALAHLAGVMAAAKTAKAATPPGTAEQTAAGESTAPVAAPTTTHPDDVPPPF